MCYIIRQGYDSAEFSWGSSRQTDFRENSIVLMHYVGITNPHGLAANEKHCATLRELLQTTEIQWLMVLILAI